MSPLLLLLIIILLVCVFFMALRNNSLHLNTKWEDLFTTNLPKSHAFLSLVQNRSALKDWFILNTLNIMKLLYLSLPIIVMICQLLFCIDLFSHMSLTDHCSGPMEHFDGSNTGVSSGTVSTPSNGLVETAAGPSVDTTATPSVVTTVAPSADTTATPSVETAATASGAPFDERVPTQETIALCDHNFHPIQDPTMVGVACDFKGPGNHTAVTTPDTSVHYCRACFAICCNTCYKGD